MNFEIVNEVLPVIQINFEELKAGLTKTMEKYKGYIVTEDNLSLCKETKNELLHIRTDIENYRKTKKKILSEPIALFEAQCKELTDLVEKAENPIREGIKTFDDKKRNDNRVSAEILIKHSISKHELNDKFAAQLTVLDEYTNLTAKEKKTAEDIENRALFLKEQQTKELDMLEIIKDTIENANKNINAKLSLADFQKLISQGTSTKEVINEIHSRAERIKKSEVEAEELRVKKELAAKQAEIDKLKALETPQEEVKVTPIVEVKEQSIEQIPLKIQVTTPDPQKMFFVEIRIVGNKDDTTKLGDFLKENNYNYKVINKGLVE